MTFHARAIVGDEALPLTVHPVLSKYLKFDVSQPPDHDFGLSTEEYFSSAVHPPVYVLILDNEQGLPQNIEVRASDKGSGIGVTVEDVLKAIGADLRKSFSQREWAALNEDIQSEVEFTFLNRARTEDARTNGPLRIDYLRGRNRLQIFPKDPNPEDEEIALLPLNHPSGMLEVAGPSSAPLRASYRGKGRAVRS
ncbi:hypothetical protein EDB85DRAFT_1542853 [Lactarius pseudohatsudake]|nr:hypothetical protein EDB85DRAFT_1542853 [Lactarius pseudohatsudake]